MPVYNLVSNAKAVQTIAAIEAPANNPNGGVNPVAQPANPAGSTTPAASQGFQLTVTAPGGVNVSAGAQIVVSNDGANWTNLGTAMSATSAAGSSSAISSNSNAPYQYFAAYITAISGTGAVANVTMCA